MLSPRRSSLGFAGEAVADAPAAAAVGVAAAGVAKGLLTL